MWEDRCGRTNGVRQDEWGAVVVCMVVCKLEEIILANLW